MIGSRKSVLIMLLIISITLAGLAIATVSTIFSTMNVFPRIKRSWTYSDPYREYVAKIFVDDIYIGSIYIRIPNLIDGRYLGRIFVSLTHKEGTTIDNLEIKFEPPPGGVAILSWIAPTGTFPQCVEFRVKNLGTLWRCSELGEVGKGTITLEFQPYNVKPPDLSNIVITTRFRITYNSKTIEILDTTTIPPQKA